MEVDDLNRSRRTADESALRARVLAGDTEAWRCLYEQCFGPLFAYVFHRAGREREQTVSEGLEVAEQVALALSELPSRYQEVLRAKYGEELPVVEIARRSGVSSKSVESLLFRARAAFQTVYQRIEAS